MFLPICTIGLMLILAGCGGENSASRVAAPGEEPSTKTKVLEAGATLLQNREPVDKLNVYVDGFHFPSGSMQEQMEAHHFCAVVNEDLHQCVLFDGNAGDAKLMGIEYIVSQRLFDRLPAEEKKLWHSHVYEVKSGQLMAPGIPAAAEHELMEKLVGTYGKTWHTWPTHRQNDLPVGPPVLMMGFTADGQLRPELTAGRDARFNSSMVKNRERRTDIPAPSIDPAADAWQHGPAPQVSLGTVRSR